MTAQSDPVEAALVEPARVQVIELAAAVLGRLPAEEVPPSLRAISRFAPAKRARLGAVALAAALDADETFRARVAEAVEQSFPELTAAVGSGTSTAAADPIDVAVIAYLTRPPEWPEILSAATARWAAERGPDAARQDELERLRTELGELRTAAKGEAARIREAVAEATGEAEAELAVLRKAVRDRTRELRAAERERNVALTARSEQQAGFEALLATAVASHQAELRRMKARQSELERALESARRGSRTERDLDDARLWLLVDTLVQAAGGVRRELSLSPPSLRPADVIESAGDESARRSAGDPATLDRLLALPNVHLIIDGYNVTKSGYPELSLADQRARLIGALAPLAAQTRAEVTIAFDGGSKPPAQPATPRDVRVLFSAADEIADDLIRRLVAAEPRGRPVVVVTSDQQVVRDTARDGAWTAPSTVLLARLG